ncbi:unnamed protein product [Tuwongella immobilis]|uniref:Uncharacterized protein n=1 Tax=Tuwongella immobilis TaxID=692036 RepID=A0A6C2YUT7_9BACT|nr:unnamed protein product [Tuwongella immobilis]VTS08116.1 unnamed protein product [Tuwongella immobilis]
MTLIELLVVSASIRARPGLVELATPIPAPLAAMPRPGTRSQTTRLNEFGCRTRQELSVARLSERDCTIPLRDAMRYLTILIVFWLVSFNQTALAQRVNDSEKARLIREGWNQLYEQDRQPTYYQIRFRASNANNGKIEFDRATQIEYGAKQQNQTLKSENSIMCMNSMYSFLLHHKPDSSPWLLASSELNSIDSSGRTQNSFFQDLTENSPSAGHVYPSSFFDSSSCHLLLSNNAIEFLSIRNDLSECEIRYRRHVSNVTVEYTGTLTLDPQAHSIITQAKLQGTNPKGERIDYQFKRDYIRDHDLIRTRSNSIQFSVGKNSSTRDYEYTYGIKPFPILTKLSDYGFPEPEGVVWPAQTPVWVWLLAAAAGLMLLALLFRTLQQRAVRKEST